MQPVGAMRDMSVYNNIMYALAGRVAEELGGASWEQLVLQEILTPLGMNNTTFYHWRQQGPSSTHSYAKQYFHMGDETLQLDYFTYLLVYRAHL